MARGLFLDLDGTLADTLPRLRQAYRDFLARFGRAGSCAEFERLNGPPLAEIVAALARGHALAAPPPDLLATYSDLVAAAQRQAPARDGAAELMAMARRRGWAVAVVTSATEALARNWLRGAGLEDLVDAVIGGDQVRRGKPDPEPYLVALARTGCDAGRSIAVEDSPSGDRAPASAGIPSWAIDAVYRRGWPAGIRFIDRFDQLAAEL